MATDAEAAQSFRELRQNLWFCPQCNSGDIEKEYTRFGNKDVFDLSCWSCHHTWAVEFHRTPRTD